MRDDNGQRGGAKAGSADRKTRIDGDRVIHTPNGQVYSGNDAAERPMGLTAEQAENQRTGWKVDERNVREAAQGEAQATEWGDTGARQPVPGEGSSKNASDELAAAPYGKKPQQGR
jgi:hypothetical protein